MDKPKKILLRSTLCPGDIVMLTAAVRDLHKCYPGQFITGVDTTNYSLWSYNPYITRFENKEEPEVQIINCEYDIIQESNRSPRHFIEGYIQDLNQKLRLNIRPTAIKGDIHLSKDEKSWQSQVSEITGDDLPFWIIAAGGKYDYTIKWWSHKRYQEVVDHFQGKIRFVQVGAADHHHLPLKNVIDLRGKTTLRQLTRLVYHSQGVLCGVTSLMHLAAAVEPRWSPLRPCVVVAGGREPAHWEAYPGHQFIHTIGALSCCASGGCWKARTVKLNDGKEQDKNLCVNVVNSLPRCMDMITSEEVIRRIQLYFDGGTVKYL